jgi:CheY-like chemotaxis protein
VKELSVPGSDDGVDQQAGRGGPRVLVAEDNDLNQLVAEGMLRLLGYSSRCVPDGLQAVEALHAGEYPIVLMDVHMPRLDGYAATRRVRAELPAGRQPYIIALTASVLPTDAEQCMAAGMNDFVMKPISKASLGAALRRAEQSVRS